MRSRTSLPIGVRPPVRLALDNHFQYSRKPARCHSTTVRGVTRIRGFCQLDQSLLRTTQNSFCRVESRRRGRLECNASSCWRRATFSRMRSFLEPKLMRIQPKMCRSKLIMSGDHTGRFRSRPFQVLDLMNARSFEEVQRAHPPAKSLGFALVFSPVEYWFRVSLAAKPPGGLLPTGAIRGAREWSIHDAPRDCK
jgi:hypothetical protein